MNIKNILLASVLTAGCMSVSAQQNVKNMKTAVVFEPHWYIQVQAGMQHTTGEIEWKDLNSFNCQLTGGYQMTPVWGMRLAVNAFQSKAGAKVEGYEFDPTIGQPVLVNTNTYKWDWKYVAPTVDVMFNFTNYFWGYEPDRVVDVNVFAGLGVNVGWGNDDANTAAQKIEADPYTANQGNQAISRVWDSSNAFFVGQWGADIDFRINDVISLGIEAQWNAVCDRYNSKGSKSADNYFNALAGIKFNL